MNFYLLPLLLKRGREVRLAVVILAACLGAFSCKPDKRFSNEEALPLLLPSTGRVEVIAYCYPPSTHTVRICAQKREFLDRMIRQFSHQIGKQPSYLQASSQKLLELCELERRLMATSTNWPVICVQRLLLPEEKPSRYLALLRNANRPLDIVLVITSEEQMHEPEAFDLVRSAIRRLESLSDEDWKNWRPGPKEVFAADGYLNPPELQRATEGAVFVGPPN